MAAPLYFLPRLKREHLTPSILAARGLADVARDAAPDCIVSQELQTPGPDGLPGLVVAINSPGQLAPPRFGHYPKTNAWQRVSDDLYIGLDTLDPVTPRDIQRPSRRLDESGQQLPPHPGHKVTTANGHTWEIPAVRRPFSRGTSLPRYWGRDAAGHLTESIDPAYQAAWDATEPLHALYYTQDGAKELPVEQIADLCVLALSLNYRVTWPLQTHARLFASSDWNNLLAALADYPTFLAAIDASKKEPPAKPPA